MGLVLALLIAAAPAAPQRIVSMAPTLTDLVVELGARDRLVGVSRFDTDAALNGLPRVGGYLDPSLEAVVKLKPDLVLALGGVAFEPVVRAMQAARLNVLSLRSDTLAEIQSAIETLGGALGVKARSRDLWTELSGLIAQVRVANQALPPVRCAIAVGFRPLVLAGQGSYLEPLLQAAGGVNVATSTLAWPTSSVEQLVAAAPAVLIDGGAAEEDAASQRLIELLRANGTRVVRLTSDALFRPGPRSIRALPELARALRGGP
jgi:iron complex transport system substrate-binding protein